MAEERHPITALLEEPKFYIVDRQANTIQHRELTKFEIRNKSVFLITKSHHATFEEARAELLRVRADEVTEAWQAYEMANHRMEAAEKIEGPQ